MKFKSLSIYLLTSSIFLLCLLSILKIMSTLQGIDFTNLNISQNFILGICLSLGLLVVGNKLKDLGQNKQVLCVTHLAQVASKGKSHLRINKLTDNKKTKIYATQLNPDERIEEIARMIGGIELTEKTREYADCESSKTV